jgi:hypothetical protein
MLEEGKTYATNPSICVACGRFSMMLKLRFSNIDDDKIHFYRSKTLHTSREKREIEALLTPEMKQIIDR